MSREAARERVTLVPSKSTYFHFGEAQCVSCNLSPTLDHAATWENEQWLELQVVTLDSTDVQEEIQAETMNVNSVVTITTLPIAKKTI